MALRIHDTRAGKKVPFEPIVPGKVSLSLQSGEIVSVETPGGGGWGAPKE